MLAADDPAQLANLEGYLLSRVGQNFRSTGNLSTDDFWLILIWKANRAKNNERRRFERIGACSFDTAVQRMVTELRQATTPRARLQVLMEGWEMRLPTASAVLTILFPHDFTVYDIRVCDQLGGWHDLSWKRYSHAVWDGYTQFVEAAKSAAPDGLSLREIDHYHWGRSLMHDVHEELSKPTPSRNPTKPRVKKGNGILNG